MMTEEVLAAGGVVIRPGNGSLQEVALVHRPAYDDWTLPKGKLLPGEEFEQGALREVEEETGFRCLLREPVGVIRYRDRKGRPKIVRYWTMVPQEGAFHPTEEVDQLVWLPLESAEERLTYDHDRELLRSLRESHKQ
jgi:8-oxo-dGTP diphosphatase